MKKVVEKVNTLTEDFENELYYDKEEIINKYSYDLGKDEGIEETKIEIIKNLLRKNLLDADILEITNITIEQLEEIKNNLNN